jgi:DNA polymerase-3 subunit epsilon
MYAVIDFETTNRVEDRRATEVAIGVLDSNFKLVSKFESVVNPKTKVYQESLGYARLTLREINEAPTFEQLWPTIAKLLSGNLLVMHSSDFDRGVLANEFDSMGLDGSLPPAVCTLKNSQRILPGRKKSGGYSLENLASDLGFGSPSAHQAMDDVLMTAKLFEYLYKQDVDLQKTCKILLEDAVEYEVTGVASEAAPRVRHQAGGKNEAELESIAQEILENDDVQELSEVCRTGTLQDRDAFEAALESIYFVLMEAEPRKGTAFLVQGAKAGARKVEKALSYGRPVLTEEEALRVIELIKEIR